MVAFIEAFRDRFGVEPVCRALRQAGVRISPSGYYAARARPPPARAVRDAALEKQILRVYKDSGPGAGGEFGDVLVDGGAADAEQSGDGDGVLRPGQQIPGVADLLGGQGRRPPEAHVAGAGGVQSLLGASTISSRMNSASAAKT